MEPFGIIHMPIEPTSSNARALWKNRRGESRSPSPEPAIPSGPFKRKSYTMLGIASMGTVDRRKCAHTSSTCGNGPRVKLSAVDHILDATCRGRTGPVGSRDTAFLQHYDGALDRSSNPFRIPQLSTMTSISLFSLTTPFCRPTRLLGAALFAWVVLLPAPVLAQEADEPVTPLDGTLERITVHGPSLEGNLVGDDPDRPVSVYLPPSYDASSDRRYPVLYVLHGFTDSDLTWFGWEEHFVNVPAAMERALEAGEAQEMILVMPNAFTAFEGSMYSSSVNTGDWERYVAEDLVDAIDEEYRTMANRDSRGLAGHSMGGYGTVRIGMKRPDVFSSIYAMSPCCMRPNLDPDSAAAAQAAAIDSIDQIPETDFFTKAQLASAAAWSPDPTDPPLYIDLPTSEGEERGDVVARWVANAPLATVHQYVPELRRLTAIGLDAGAQDQPIAGSTERLSEILNRYDVHNTFEIYDPGNHVNRVGERVEDVVLPFFSEHLSVGARSN